MPQQAHLKELEKRTNIRDLVHLKWEFIQDWQQVFICGNTFS